MAPKRQFSYTVAFKLQVCEDAEKKRIRTAATSHGVDHSMVGWLKKENDIDAADVGGSKRRRISRSRRSPVCAEMDKELGRVLASTEGCSLSY